MPLHRVGRVGCYQAGCVVAHGQFDLCETKYTHFYPCFEQNCQRTTRTKKERKEKTEMAMGATTMVNLVSMAVMISIALPTTSSSPFVVDIKLLVPVLSLALLMVEAQLVQLGSVLMVVVVAVVPCCFEQTRD